MRLALARALIPAARASSIRPTPRAPVARRRPSLRSRDRPGFSTRSSSFARPAAASAAMEVHQFPCLNDNYSFLLHDPNSGATAVVDTPEVAPIEAALAERGWTLTHILNTHHHWDHTGGNEELKKRHPGVRVIGPARETKGAIPGLDRAVVEGDVVELGAIEARVLDTPGHTAGHVCYHFPSERKIFVGDTLFAMGCGRLFEGDAETMLASVRKITALPGDTQVYCAHEYTMTNAKFAATVEPENAELARRVRETEAMRAAGIPTVPTTVEKELATNPFCRSDSEGLRRTLGMEGADDVAVFAETRRRKDAF